MKKSKLEKAKYHPSHYMCNNNNNKNPKQTKRPLNTENKLAVAREEGGGWEMSKLDKGD